MSWLLYVFAIFYGYSINRHFGGHWWPSNDAELIADGIGLLLVALAILTSAVERIAVKSETRD